MAVGGGGHAHDGGVQVHGPGRAVEGGVAVGVDPAVGAHQPVAVAARGGRDADDRGRKPRPQHRAVDRGVAVAVDGAVGGGQPVALAHRRRGDVDHRCGAEGRQELLLAHERGPRGRGARGGRGGGGGPISPERRLGLPPGVDRVGGRRARRDHHGGQGGGPCGGGRAHRQRRCGPVAVGRGELLQDDVAVRPAARGRRRGAVGVGGGCGRAPPAVLVHPQVVGEQGGRGPPGPDGPGLVDGGAAGERGGVLGVGVPLGPGLGVGVELGGEGGHRGLAAPGALEVHEHEDLLGDAQGVEGRHVDRQAAPRPRRPGRCRWLSASSTTRGRCWPRGSPAAGWPRRRGRRRGPRTAGARRGPRAPGRREGAVPQRRSMHGGAAGGFAVALGVPLALSEQLGNAGRFHTTCS